MDYGNLFHDEIAFQRETFEERMQQYGFKNMGRMELFLWDLELFLQIQKILGDRIVLKGGAAAQFYLPIEVQRTSVDIDMLFFGTECEVEDALHQIETLLKTKDGLFQFHRHMPKKPKTALPLHTYYVNVPSVLTEIERNVKEVEDIPCQELKIEFIFQKDKWKYTKKTGEHIFAVNSNWEYQILPINSLFADKLTTLGPQTVGVQNDRMDEQVKQFYDIIMLTKHCLSQLQASEVKEMYIARANEEWKVRIDTPCDLDEIVADVRKQLLRYEMADGGEDGELKKYINDFRSLYLNSKVDYTPQAVSCGAALVKLMYEFLLSGDGWDWIKKVLKMEQSLELPHMSGREKGQKIRSVRDTLIQEFGSYSAISPKVLKGKNLKRVFWAVVDKDNLEDIASLLKKII